MNYKTKREGDFLFFWLHLLLSALVFNDIQSHFLCVFVPQK